jgi:tripartite-type tricarboxylate transporter receptor subunit TctC
MGKNMTANLFLLVVLFFGINELIPGMAEAAELYPSRPIQLIVPFPPGGLTDLVGRPFASSLEKVLKQPVAIVNKPGAGGVVGMQAASIAKPDGYTLMVALSAISVMPEIDIIFGRPPTYKMDNFIPIARLTADPNIFVVRKEAPWKTLQEFVADAKSRPNEIKYSSAGVYSGLHITMELFMHAAGIQLRHIPTAGGGPGLTAALGGHVECMFTAPNIVLSHVRAGTLRVLAGSGDKRLAALPNVPTLKELGYDVEFYAWSGFFAPKATPPDIIEILREASKKAINSQEFKTAMQKIETPIAYLDADDFKRFWDKDAKIVIEAVRRLGKVQ